MTFLLTAAVIFFFVVKPVNALMTRFKTEPEVETPTKDCPQCLSSVPAGARRCAFCTSELAAV
jgi:large conductance mechanosensitive channel